MQIHSQVRNAPSAMKLMSFPLTQDRDNHPVFLGHMWNGSKS
jgi:hypothetical protein